MLFSKNKIYLCLLLIILIGAGSRLYHLTRDDIWYDESVSVHAAKMSFPEMIQFTLGSDITDFPPVYYTLLKGWILIFGDSPFSVRASSALPGIAAILLFFFLGRILWDEKYGLLVAFLLAISPFHVAYSQETRTYALQIFLLLFSAWCFLRFLLQNNRLWGWTYIFIMCLSVHVHFFSLFFGISLAGFHCFYLCFKEKTIIRILQKLWVQWVLLAGLLPILVFRYLHRKDDLIGWVPKFTFASYRHTIVRFFFGAIPRNTPIMYNIAIGLFIFSVFFSLWYLFKSTKPWHLKTPLNKLDSFSSSLFAWFLFLGPILLFSVISLTVHQIYAASRYLIIGLPGFLMVLSFVFLQVPNRVMKIGLILIMTFLSLFSLMQMYMHANKIGMKSVSEYIQKEGNPDDVIYFVPGYHQGSFDYYFRGDIHRLDQLKTKDWFESSKKASYLYPRTWLVLDSNSMSRIDYFNTFGYVSTLLGAPVNTEYLPPNKLEIYLFVRKEPGTLSDMSTH